jgi:hypothetical protein
VRLERAKEELADVKSLHEAALHKERAEFLARIRELEQQLKEARATNERQQHAFEQQPAMTQNIKISNPEQDKLRQQVHMLQLSRLDEKELTHTLRWQALIAQEAEVSRRAADAEMHKAEHLSMEKAKLELKTVLKAVSTKKNTFTAVKTQERRAEERSYNTAMRNARHNIAAANEKAKTHELARQKAERLIKGCKRSTIGGVKTTHTLKKHSRSLRSTCLHPACRMSRRRDFARDMLRLCGHGGYTSSSYWMGTMTTTTACIRSFEQHSSSSMKVWLQPVRGMELP